MLDVFLLVFRFLGPFKIEGFPATNPRGIRDLFGNIEEGALSASPKGLWKGLPALRAGNPAIRAPLSKNKYNTSKYTG